MGLLQAIHVFQSSVPAPRSSGSPEDGLKAVHANRFFPAVQGGGRRTARSSDQEWRCIRKKFRVPDRRVRRKSRE